MSATAAAHISRAYGDAAALVPARPMGTEPEVMTFVERFAAEMVEAGMQRTPARVFAALPASEDGALSSAGLTWNRASGSRSAPPPCPARCGTSRRWACSSASGSPAHAASGTGQGRGPNPRPALATHLMPAPGPGLTAAPSAAMPTAPPSTYATAPDR